MYNGDEDATPRWGVNISPVDEENRITQTAQAADLVSACPSNGLKPTCSMLWRNTR